MPRATVPNTNAMLRDFFLGFIKVHVLHHASKGPLYGVWFLEELSKHGYQLSPGTLYPLLHGLEAEGYLEREERVVEGKVRKYYGRSTKSFRCLPKLVNAVFLSHSRNSSSRSIIGGPSFCGIVRIFRLTPATARIAEAGASSAKVRLIVASSKP